MSYCQSCGHKIENNTAKFCPNCGKQTSPAKSLKKLITLLIIGLPLCFFLLILTLGIFSKKNISKPTKTNKAPKALPATRRLSVPKYAFSCQVPPKWTTHDQNNMIHIYGPANTHAKEAAVLVQRFFYNPERQYTLKDLGDSLINLSNTYPQFTVIEDRQGSLSRKTTVEFFHTQKNKMYKWQQVLLKDKNRIYVIGYIVPSNIYETYHHVMKTVVKTFKFM